jgi:hypothetical protein
LADEGLHEIHGVVFIEDEVLVLRVEKKLLGLFDSDSKTIEVEPGALEEIRVQRGLFKDKLLLKPWRSELFDLIPGTHGSHIILKVPRKERAELEALVDAFDTLF